MPRVGPPNTPPGLRHDWDDGADQLGGGLLYTCRRCGRWGGLRHSYPCPKATGQQHCPTCRCFEPAPVPGYRDVWSTPRAAAFTRKGDAP